MSKEEQIQSINNKINLLDERVKLFSEVESYVSDFTLIRNSASQLVDIDDVYITNLKNQVMQNVSSLHNKYEEELSNLRYEYNKNISSLEDEIIELKKDD